MTVSTRSELCEKLHQLHHDIQNCLSVISMGAELLPSLRNDAGTFSEVIESMETKCRMAAELVNEFYEAACEGND